MNMRINGQKLNIRHLHVHIYILPSYATGALYAALIHDSPCMHV